MADVNFNNKHVKLFLQDIQKHGRSIIKFGDHWFEVEPRVQGFETTYVIKTYKTKREQVKLSFVELLNVLYNDSLEVIEIDVIRELNLEDQLEK